jgi:GH24 family phage-related lysozyme (muramidase)
MALNLLLKAWNDGARVLTAYRDKAWIWTIGYGNTFYENGRPV